MNINLIPKQLLEEVERRNNLGIYTESNISLILSFVMLVVGSASLIRALMDIGWI